MSRDDIIHGLTHLCYSPVPDDDILTSFFYRMCLVRRSRDAGHENRGYEGELWQKHVDKLGK